MNALSSSTSTCSVRSSCGSFGSMNGVVSLRKTLKKRSTCRSTEEGWIASSDNGSMTMPPASSSALIVLSDRITRGSVYPPEAPHLHGRRGGDRAAGPYLGCGGLDGSTMRRDAKRWTTRVGRRPHHRPRDLRAEAPARVGALDGQGHPRVQRFGLR